MNRTRQGSGTRRRPGERLFLARRGGGRPSSTIETAPTMILANQATAGASVPVTAGGLHCREASR